VSDITDLKKRRDMQLAVLLGESCWWGMWVWWPSTGGDMMNLFNFGCCFDGFVWISGEGEYVCVCGEKRKRETGRCSHAGFIEREKSHGDQFY
jgi:hypothetical protein